MKKSLVMLGAVVFCLGIALGAYANLPEGTDWHKGTIAEAFDAAKKENKPMFLYWGAVWCPPCNQLKKAIFSQKLFQDTVKDYLPVYADGDAPGSQIWSSKLGVSGYPTVVIFAPSGQEVLRMPTGISVEEYTSIMKATLKQMTPVEDLLKKALKEPISNEEWYLISSYQWSQANPNTFTLSDEEKVNAFKTLYDTVPLELSADKSRLFFHYVQALMGAEKELDKAQQDDLIILLGNILRSPELSRANVESLSYYAADIVGYLFKDPKDERRAQVIDAWLKAMDACGKDETILIGTRVDTLYPALALYKLDNQDQELPEALKAQARELAALADKTAQDAYSRQSAISEAGWILAESGQLQAAKDLEIAELAKSESPYYFMRDLVSICEQMGNKEEALEWGRKSWETAVGQSTRFEWGTAYFKTILVDSPDNTELMKSTLTTLFKELLAAGDDAFSGRKIGRLGQIDTAVKTWNKDNVHAEFLAGLKTALATECDTYSNKVLCAQWVQVMGTPDK